MRRALLAFLLLPLVSFAAATTAVASTPQSLPSVSGGFGQKPSITFPSGHAPSTFEEEVLHPGSGAVVKKGDLVVVNYLGQIWGGKVFDASYNRNEAAAFPIGVGKVIPGWDRGLVGVHVGSRLLLVLPPAEGYGSAGNSQAGITGKDVLVFVIDVLGSYSMSAGGDPTAVVQHNPMPTGITVAGPLGKKPTVSVAKTAPRPTKESTTVLAKGNGAPVGPGLVVLQVVADDWTGKVVENTWTSDELDSEQVGVPSQSGPLDSLIGIPIGSRVLILLAKQGTQGPYAVAVDIVGEPSRTAAAK